MSTSTERPDWDKYFMEIAHVAAKRATCDRAHVGCVLVIHNQIVATGYNGAVAGASHCDDAGHFMEEGHCTRTNHAEVNALAQAAKVGSATDGATAYITHRPCMPCARALIAAGIKDIVYDIEYGPIPDYTPVKIPSRYGWPGYSTHVGLHRIGRLPTFL